VCICAAFPDIDEMEIIRKRGLTATFGTLHPAKLDCAAKVTVDAVTTDDEGERVKYTATTYVYGRYMMLHYKSRLSKFYEIIRPDMPPPNDNESVSVFIGAKDGGEKLCYFLEYASNTTRSKIDAVVGSFYQMVMKNWTYQYALQIDSTTAYIIGDIFRSVVYVDKKDRVVAIKDKYANYSISYGTAYLRDFSLSTSYKGCVGPRADIYGTPNESYVLCAASTAKISFIMTFIMLFNFFFFFFFF